MIKNLPSNLYIEGVVHFSQIFKNIYELELKEQKVYEKAFDFKQDKNLIGGISKEATLEHFAQRFQTSGSRNEYFFLDPDGKFQIERDQVLISLASGSISILDIACGTGGSTLAMLTTLHELRFQKIIPNLPLNLRILGIDHSNPALEIYKKIMDEVSMTFKESGIDLVVETKLWDATNPVNTTMIMDYFLSDLSIKDEYIGMINNFSGAISKNDQIKVTIEDILKRLTGKKFTFLWIESNTNDSRKVLNYFFGLIDKLKNFLNLVNNKSLEQKSNINWYNFIMKKVVSGQISLASFKRE